MKRLYVAIGYQTLDGTYPMYFFWMTNEEAQDMGFCYTFSICALSPTMEERKILASGGFVTRWG